MERMELRGLSGGRLVCGSSARQGCACDNRLCHNNPSNQRINCRCVSISDHHETSGCHYRSFHNFHRVTSPLRNVEIDWREVDPYFSELSDCASFWTLINFTCDVIYSGLFVLFFIMGQDVESMFFEGLLNHINPILIYLILSLVFNYGALRSLRSGRERCFLVFSVMKGILFPVTISLLAYLIFFDVQDYFGTFWVSFVAIVSCYNGTAALGLWSMFTCNKYILVNEAAQKKLRKQVQQQQQSSRNSEVECRCRNSPIIAIQQQSSASFCGNNQMTSASTTFPRPKPTTSGTHSRKIRDSSCANNLILVCPPPDVAATSTACSNSFLLHNPSRNYKTTYKDCRRSSGSSKSSKFPSSTMQDKRTDNVFQVGGASNFTVGINLNSYDDDEFEDVLSLGDDDEVLQISTVHKVMQEIRLLDSSKTQDNQDADSFDTSYEGDIA